MRLNSKFSCVTYFLLSDNDRTVLRAYVKKNVLITINYRSYKNFEISQFRNNLKENVESFDKNNMTYEDFERIFMRLLNWYAPMKKKVTRVTISIF